MAATAPAGLPPIETLPRIPIDHDGPVFREPWEAQAFAMTVKLHEGGLFTWNEWAAALSAQIEAAQAAGDPDLGDTYYRDWLKGVGGLVLAAGKTPAPNRAGLSVQGRRRVTEISLLRLYWPPVSSMTRAASGLKMWI